MGSKNEMEKITKEESDSPPCSKNSDLGNFSSFSKLLQGVMSPNSLLFHQNLSFQGSYTMSHQEALASVTAKAAEAHAHAQMLQSDSTKSVTDQPPTTPSKSCVSTSSTNIQKQNPQPSFEHKDCTEKSTEKNHSSFSSDPANSSIRTFPNKKSHKKKVEPANDNDNPKTPKSDGYSWRKYGQKLVKSSGSSRSYYRCSHFLCLAKKKVQHMDISGHVIEVVYKGDHNHDPPQNPKGSSQKRDDQHTPTCVRCEKEVQQAMVPSTCDNQDNSTNTSVNLSQRDAGELYTATPDLTLRLKNEGAVFPLAGDGCRSSNTDIPAMMDPMKERELAPLKKRRLKETGEAYPDTIYRTFKEPKVVVHAAGDAGTSSDGYKWRKYGQKMVKGSPHPRSYYRCSSAGCPVRKHVERATDDSASIIVTYEGKHEHDMPVVKKCHNSPKASASVATLVTPNKPLPETSKTEALSPNAEKGTEVGADKVLESARTLLSIGIELKSC